MAIFSAGLYIQLPTLLGVMDGGDQQIDILLY